VSWRPLLVNLAVTAALVAVLMLATFGYAMRTRVHAIMDTIWPLGFVLIAVVTFGLSAGSGVAGRRVLVLVLTAVWGLRLGAHIYTRNRGQGEDKRYASLLRSGTRSCAGSGPTRPTPGGCSTAGYGATPGTRTTSAMRWRGSACGCWRAPTGSVWCWSLAPCI
jgi:Protein of unknown function (DUF1295)